jgi:N-acetylneuraminic acid mutarotase
MRLLLILALACNQSPPAAGPDLAAPIGWTALQPLPVARQETAVVELGGFIYVLGGFDARQAIVDSVDRYDPATNQWTARQALPRALHHANVAAVDGKIWLVGALTFVGGDLFAAIGDIYEYDPAADSWTPHGTMPAGTERGASFVGALNGEVFVAGGLHNDSSVADFSSYAPATGQTTARQPLPAARDHGVGAVVGGRFYAIGGRNTDVTAHTNRVDVYDPTTDQWTSGAAMPTSRGGAAAAVVHGKIVVAGGEGNPASPAGVFAETELYDPAANTWRSLMPMKTPRHGTGGASIGDTFYVPGGASHQIFGAVATVETIVISD